MMASRLMDTYCRSVVILPYAVAALREHQHPRRTTTSDECDYHDSGHCHGSACQRYLILYLETCSISSVVKTATSTGRSTPVEGFSSCTSNLQAAQGFLGQAGARVQYTIEGGSSARDVRKYSAFQDVQGQQDEDEVLMPFGSAFTVVRPPRRRRICCW